MKNYRLFVFLFALAMVATSLFAQEEMTPEMQAWMEYATPGPVHEMMAVYAGEFKADMKMWQYPGAEPVVTEGHTSTEMILGGRYLQSKHTAEFMGMEMNGMSLECYDNAKKEFTSLWIDNFGTGMMLGKGKWDDATKSITYTGTSYDPSQGKDVAYREVMYYIDSDHQKMEMFMITDEGESQSMEIMFTRVK